MYAGGSGSTKCFEGNTASIELVLQIVPERPHAPAEKLTPHPKT